MNVPPSIAAEMALARQAVALSVIKQNARMQQQMASVLEQAISSVPVSSSRGANVNISV